MITTIQSELAKESAKMKIPMFSTLKSCQRIINLYEAAKNLYHAELITHEEWNAFETEFNEAVKNAERQIEEFQKILP